MTNLEKVKIVIESVCNYFEVPITNIKKKDRNDDLVDVRHALLFLLRENTNLSYKEIGKIASRDHSTAIFAHKKLLNDKSIKKHLSADINVLNDLIQFKVSSAYNDVYMPKTLQLLLDKYVRSKKDQREWKFFYRQEMTQLSA